MSEASLMVFKKRSFSSCPDDIFEDQSLSHAARGVVAFLVGRPPNWQIRISHIKSRLGISDHRWDKYRNEMISAGYFLQKKYRSTAGKWEWQNIVTDSKFEFGPETIQETTIPENTRYGETKGGKTKPDKPANKANNPSSMKPKPKAPLHAKKMEEISGIKCWYAEDKEAVIKAIEDFGIEEVKKAVEELARQGREPLPSRVLYILNGDSNAKNGTNYNTKNFVADDYDAYLNPPRFRS